MAVVLPPINPLGLETRIRVRGSNRMGKEKSEFQAMNRRDWLNSGLIIFGLLILAILVAQSRRNCESLVRSGPLYLGLSL